MIKISKMADYAVVILSEMSADPERVSSAAAISTTTSLPEPTVSKILKILAGADLVVSIRGAGGGYKLDRGAKDITVLDIITGIDGPVALVNCADPSQAACRLRETCCMLGRWDGVNAAVRDVLAEVTLTDMMWKSDVCVDFVNEGS